MDTWLGIKLTSLVAGFAGGVVSLAFIAALTRWQAIGAVTVGSLSAAYLTPGIVSYFNIGSTYENGAAFLIGLLAMQIIPLIKKAAVQRVADRVDPPPPKGSTP